MGPISGDARDLQSFDKETVAQDVRVDIGNGGPGILEIVGGKVSEYDIAERKDDHKVLNSSATDYCNGEDVEEAEEDVEVEEAGSFLEGGDSLEHEENTNFPSVRDDKLNNDNQPLPDVGLVSKQEHVNSGYPFPSTSSIFLKSTNSGSRTAVLESSNSITGAEIARSFTKCTKCNGTGNFSEKSVENNGEIEKSCSKSAANNKKIEKSCSIAEQDHGLVLKEESKPLPVNQRRPNVSEISWGMWLECFFRFVLGSIVEDLITSHPLLTSFNVVLLPISFALCFFADMLFFVVAICYDLAFVAIYIFLCIIWGLNGVVAICWHFLQLSSFSTRVAATIAEFLWDMQAVYRDEHFYKLSSR